MQINEGDSLFSVQKGASRKNPYWNFKVLRSRKGEVSDYVTVFDDVGGYCRGFLNGFKPGDTVLVFARYLTWLPAYANHFLWGDQCMPTYKLPLTEDAPGYELSQSRKLEITAFLQDSARWKPAPESAPWFKKLEPVYARPAPGQACRGWQLGLLVSLAINFLLAAALWRRGER
ncbi:MAG: hypothetical protein JNK89_03360 [Saprospiraceae bacterium]|nr:hypothetical protein [Saprospiraceae bacterium]